MRILQEPPLLSRSASAGRGFKRRVLALWGFCFAERSPRGAAVEESCGSSLGVGGQSVRERVRGFPLLALAPCGAAVVRRVRVGRAPQSDRAFVRVVAGGVVPW